MRQLCEEENLRYDFLAKHVGHKPLKLGETRRKHVKGWRVLSDSQWLQRGNIAVCVMGATAAKFIALIYSSESHPLYGVFAMGDAERLAHLLNAGWIWSNNEKVNHMHGWTLLDDVPEQPEQFLISIPPPSPYAPDANAQVRGLCVEGCLNFGHALHKACSVASCVYQAASGAGRANWSRMSREKALHAVIGPP